MSNPNTQVQVVDEHTAELVRLNGAFAEILNAAVPPTTPEQLKRLEAMEQLAFGFFRAASGTYERAWAVIFLIVEEGLWKNKTNLNGDYFTNYTDYVQSLYDEAGKYISPRTIHARISNFRALGELGVDAGTRTQVLEQVPHVVSKLLAKVVDHKTGEFVPLEPGARKDIIDAIGLQGVGVTEMSDREIVAELVEELPELGHRDASNLISRLIREWKHSFFWIQRDQILVIKFYAAGRGQRVKTEELRFKLIGGNPKHSEIAKWLEGMRKI